MSDLMSDADVFGGSNTLSDAEVFGSGKVMSDAAAGFTPGYWSAPRVTAPSTSTLSTLVRHPIATLSDLASRFSQSAEHEAQHGVTGSIIDVATDQALRHDVGGVAGGAAVAQRRDYQRSTAPMPAKSFLEGAANLAGGLYGGLHDPTSYISPQVKGLTLFGGPILNAVAGHAIGGALTGAALDNVQQGLNINRGQQDKYSLGELASAAVLQGGLGGVGHGAKALSETSRALAEAMEPWATGHEPGWRPPAPIPKPTAPPASTATTLRDLWPRLVNRESGDDQGAVSEKGARGAAQLMPGTAQEVATQIGRPDLAHLAMEDSPAGKQANEYLGQVYLGQQLEAFGGDPALALAAYNAGPGRVREWLAKIGHPDAIGRGAWIDMIPFDETRNYVRHILGDAAGGPGKITPEMAQLRESMRGETAAPAAEAAEPTAAERALATSDEAVQTLPGEPDTAPAAATPHAAQVSEEITKDLHEFPGDRETGSGPVHEDIPWDSEEPTGAALPEVPSVTDEALDHMRAGTRPKMADGPSLLEALVKEGGVRDEGGELTAILGGSGDNRLLKMLRRVNTGKTLDDAALWAQERGFIGGSLDEGHPRVSQEDLLNALRREAAGDKVYPEHAVNHHGQLIADHMTDLEEVLSHIGMDPRTHSNAEIRDAMDRMFAHHESVPEAMAMAAAKNDHGAEAVVRARAARERMRQREEILGQVDAASGNLPGSRRAGAVPDHAGATPLETNFAQIWRNLKTVLDVPVRAGRITMRKALGTYNRKTGVVRVLNVHDVGVEAHELAHAMEFTKRYPTLLAEMAKHSQTLKAMDYDPRAARRHEGFAEFVRWYVVNPTYAKQRAPLFYGAFESAMAHDDPAAFESLKMAQANYSAIMSAPSLKSAAANIVGRKKPGLLGSFMNIVRDRGVSPAVQMVQKEFGNEIYRGLVDQLHPWKMATDELLAVAGRNGVSTELPAAYDPYKLLRMVPASAQAGHMDNIFGVHGYHQLDPETAGLSDALELALGGDNLTGLATKIQGVPDKVKDALGHWDPQKLREFDAYLIARRVRHDYANLGNPEKAQPPDWATKDYWEQIITDGDAQNPTWERAAEMVYDWNTALWKKRHDAGYLTEEQHQEGLDNNPDYVPLFRDMSDTKGSFGGQKGLDTKYAGQVKRRAGTSMRLYMSPVESMLQNSYVLNAQIALNDALKALDDMGRVYGPDAGRVVERIPAHEMQRIRVGVEELIEDVAKKNGHSRRDQVTIAQTVSSMFNEDSGHIYRPIDAPERGEPILYVWRDGERIPLRLPDGKWGKHMVEAFSGATPQMHSLMLEFAALPARLVRAGTTLHPSFFFSNTIRDQMTASLLTDVGYVPGVDMARGLKEAVNPNSDLMRRYNVVGGEIGGMHAATEREARVGADVNVLRKQGFQVRKFASWDGLWKGWANVIELSETGTRLGLFNRGVDRFTKEGMGDWEAAREAAFEARDYMDFDRHGAWPAVNVGRRIIPFMNAGIQALDKVRRVGTQLANPASGHAVADRLQQLGMNGSNPILAALTKAPSTPQEQKAFDAALKLWIGASLLAVGSLALRAANQGNPEYEEASDYMRSTGWVVPLPNGELAVIPKPYEIAAPGTALERVFEGVTMHDPTAWGRLAEGLATQLTPNLNPSALAIPYQLAANRDTFGSPIVPDQLENVDPQFQYTERTSRLAKAVGRMTKDLPGAGPQSPAKVDYIIKSLGSSLGRDALAATGQGRAPIDKSAAESPVVSRFVKDWTKGAVSTKQFYSLVSGTNGEWVAGVNSVNKLVHDGEVDKAVAYMGDMKPEQRAYTVMQLLGEGGDKDLHPMVRAQKVSQALQSMAFDIQQGNVQVATPQGLQVVELTKHQRREAVDALHRMAVAEQRNAMIVANVDGWGQREPLPYEKYAMKLGEANSALPLVLAQRGMLTDQHLNAASQTYHAWRILAPRMAAIPPEALKAALEEKNNKGRAGALRALEQTVAVR